MAENNVKTKPKKSVGQKTLDMVYIAVFAVIIAVCSWISVPMVIPFTLQTFGVFCAVGLLGGKRGTLSVLIYVLLGAVGIPVFSGFSSGIGTLFGVTGGYIMGFIFTALVYWLITSVFGKKLWSIILGMVLGLLACYAFGTIWFIAVYAHRAEPVGLALALSKCVVPFLVPDALKIALAVIITRTVPKYVKIFD